MTRSVWATLSSVRYNVTVIKFILGFKYKIHFRKQSMRLRNMEGSFY